MEETLAAALEDEHREIDRAIDAYLTASADDNLNVAYRLSQTATVASNLSITTDALNTGFAAARKAIAVAAVDAALAAGKITSDQAAATAWWAGSGSSAATVARVARNRAERAGRIMCLVITFAHCPSAKVSLATRERGDSGGVGCATG